MESKISAGEKANISQVGPPRPRRRRSRGPVLNYIEYFGLVAVVELLNLLPHDATLRVGASIGSFYGWFARIFRTRNHRVSMRNLELAFPEKSPNERDSILRATWRNWGRFMADGVKLAKIPPARVKELVTIEPWERFLEVQKIVKDRGLLVLTGHYGSFELLHAAISAHGVPVTLVHRPMANPYVSEWVRKLRTRFGTNVVARGEAARDVLRELKSGRFVAIPFDQNARQNIRVFAPFFNVRTSTNSGLARLARATDAPVHPVVIIREGDGLKHKIWIGEAVQTVKTGDREADIVEYTRLYNKAFEDLIRAHPDHWIWMYRRFKQQPEGTCSPYLKEAPGADAYRMAAAS